jgi:hypothetical protein
MPMPLPASAPECSEDQIRKPSCIAQPSCLTLAGLTSSRLCIEIYNDDPMCIPCLCLDSVKEEDTANLWYYELFLPICK